MLMTILSMYFIFDILFFLSACLHSTKLLTKEENKRGDNNGLPPGKGKQDTCAAYVSKICIWNMLLSCEDCLRYDNEAKIIFVAELYWYVHCSSYRNLLCFRLCIPKKSMLKILILYKYSLNIKNSIFINVIQLTKLK